MSITFSQISQALARIQPYIHHTPILQSRQIDGLLGCELFFKAENLQKVGAFKARGGCNAIFSMDEAELHRGVITHSSGNHGAALAWAASLRGADCTVVMPSNAPLVKKQAVRGYGAKVVECLPSMADREATVAAEIKAAGSVMVHPYDSDVIIAGQGTAALETLAQLDTLHKVPDIIMSPVGGGGLLAGTAIATRALAAQANTTISVIGAEPQGASDAWQGFTSGQRVEQYTPDTIADGLRATLGVRNFEIIQQQVNDIVLASEQGIVDAMRLIWMRMKIIVEPSAAVCLAAVMENPQLFYGKRVAIILSGGNVDLDALPF